MVLQITPSSERLKSISRSIEKVFDSLEAFRLGVVTSKISRLAEEIKKFGGPGSGPRPGRGKKKGGGGGGGFREIKKKGEMNAFEKLHTPRSKLTSDEIDAVDNYQAGENEGMNRLLRTGKGSKRAESRVENLNSAFDKTPPLQEDVVLYRGLNVGRFTDKNGTMPGQITDKGFVSTSLNVGIANSFSEGRPKGAVMEIKVPKGTRVLSVNAIQGFSGDEREFILSPSSTFKILSSSRRKGLTGIDTTFIQAELVG